MNNIYEWLFLKSIKRHITAQKMKFSIKDFFSKCEQIRSFMRIWSHLLKKSLMENFIFVQCIFNTYSLNNNNQDISIGLKILYMQSVLIYWIYGHDYLLSYTKGSANLDLNRSVQKLIETGGLEHF